MLETHLKSPVTRHRLRSGPATQHVDAFAEWLHRQGYRPVTIDTTLRSLAGWTDWMREAGLSNHLRRDSSWLPGIMRSRTPLESGPRLHSGAPTSHNRGVRIIGSMQCTAYRRVRARSDSAANQRRPRPHRG